MADSSEPTVPADAVTGDDTTQIGVHEIAVAMGAGTVGQIPMIPFFVVAYVLGATSPESFVGLAQLIGVSGDSSLALPVGVVLFVAGGSITLPVLFVSLAEFLPPERSIALRGVSFAAIVWTGFVLAFSTGQSGWGLVLYGVLSLGAHAAYGFTLGALYDRFADAPRYDV